MVHPGDSPPMSDKDRSSNRMERTKKKVEWSSNLSSVESFAPEDRSPNWDSETGESVTPLFSVNQPVMITNTRL